MGEFNRIDFLLLIYKLLLNRLYYLVSIHVLPLPFEKQLFAFLHHMS